MSDFDRIIEEGLSRYPVITESLRKAEASEATACSASPDQAAGVADAMNAGAADAVELDRLRKENDHLRASLANGGGPCAYCDLSREDWAKCSAGFPGCPRADDANLCQHIGSWLHVQGELTEAEGRFALLLIAFHDAIRRPLGVTPDSGAEFYDQRMADEAEERRSTSSAIGGNSANSASGRLAPSEAAARAAALTDARQRERKGP